MAFTVKSQTLAKEKERRYDRQLRLWGDHGQQALENAHVCLINASATGTEILKNLVLPGIGAFTILDGNKVSGEDIGNNFFLDKSSIGESRAKTAMNLIQELNSDVSGNFVEEAVEKVLEKEPTFFHKFTVVITTQLPQSTLLRLAAALWEAGVPLLACRAYGMTGYMRVALREHTVVESHPDNALEDLRLDRPFPALVKHLASCDLALLDKKEHSHTPWLVVVAKYLDVWRSQHDGSLPKNYKEKDQFKELIRQGMIKNEHGASSVEENFEEAIKNTTTALNPTRIPDVVRQLFSDPSCQSLSAKSADFWVLVRALRDFVEAEGGEGALPLRGSIPDMIADSDKFVRLQNVYREKAKQDADAVGKLTASLLHSLGRPADGISEGDVRLFCKHAAFLRVVRCRSLAEEYDAKTALTADIGSQLESAEGEAVLYVMLRAVDRFYQQYGRYPGVRAEDVDRDVAELRACVAGLLHEWGLHCTVKDEYLHEFCRYGAAEPHTVASFIGGTAAQEAIKVITHQFVPFNDTFIYNAMAQTSLTLRI
ncbi:NEDD8-activating enzyme E1 regulatory subunit [Petromyzon marinus]|uniref:NEDD8-activating enzyme E1 regulatory subunit n=1 Tax=Petromyzon marinus TaxID=7757 RepID=A0AAJ7UEM7_PETMA|nr:NEDD8-activating enzyme E1 regulatory subunit [Petromyzon marinus]